MPSTPPAAAAALPKATGQSYESRSTAGERLMIAQTKLWSVVLNGTSHRMMSDLQVTDQKVIRSGLIEMDAANICHSLNKAALKKERQQIRDVQISEASEELKKASTGVIHKSAEATGWFVKTFSDGYKKGRS